MGKPAKARRITALRPYICNKPRVPHISLVFREMWDTTNLDLNSPLEVESLRI